MQAFYKRFSGPIRALPPEPAGADAWRATTYGHGVLQTNPLGSALDQESPGSIPGGATRSAARALAERTLRRRAGGGRREIRGHVQGRGCCVVRAAAREGHDVIDDVSGPAVRVT